uniref:Pseudouridine-5'-phosphate glycosidase n=1 Tax=Caenorhabditis japonica TaxID=281687 RepID=A0A8R1I1H0_CAEJA
MYSRCFYHKRGFSKFLHVSPRVKEALANGEGVVALESTVITHGLPYPHNLNTAHSLEDKVRATGSLPATIALFDGKIHIGLDNEKLEKLASSKNAVKVSTRDIAKTIIKKEVGGTTVASTMKIAHAAGISVFATGGIGGVHRGADQTFDVSADLQELSKTPVIVVCSGVKSILDISKTVEYLETHSVNCVVYGNENIFPSFFTRKSNSKAQFCTDKLEDIVELMRISKSLGLPSGTVLACPIPEAYATDGDIIQKAIDTAVQEATSQNIASQDVTPFILARVNQLTKGASMATNIALLENNASIAGRLAAKLSDRRPITNSGQPPSSTSSPKKPTVVSIGATIVDFEAITSENVKVSE